jgi:hypothetical protein
MLQQVKRFFASLFSGKKPGGQGVTVLEKTKGTKRGDSRATLLFVLAITGYATFAIQVLRILIFRR